MPKRFVLPLPIRECSTIHTDFHSSGAKDPGVVIPGASYQNIMSKTERSSDQKNDTVMASFAKNIALLDLIKSIYRASPSMMENIPLFYTSS